MDKGSNTNIGVYKILNKQNGNMYIGSTSRGFIKRWQLHKQMLRKGTHHSIILQRAWNKYGENNFIFDIIENCIPENCILREQYYIDTLLPKYNIDKCAGSPYGRKLSNDQINKIRIRMAGEKNPFYGKHHSDETKKLISKKLKGILKGKFVGDKNPMYKKDHSPENKILMSDASKSFWNSSEGEKLKQIKSKLKIGKPNEFALKGELHPKYNNKIFRFENFITKSVFIGTVYNFRKKFNIGSLIYYVIKGIKPQFKGWKVTYETL